jgi:aryl-alcohol dehydrogenase-like predicted oxidoreductase
MALPPLPLRALGRQGLWVPAQGLGTMGMTAFYAGAPSERGTTDRAAREEEALATIAAYVDACAPHPAFLDTAWIYRTPTEHNETLVGKAIAAHGRDRFVIATKCGIDYSNPARPFNASEAAVRTQLAASLARLGTLYVDLYYQHRQDPDTPIEDVAATFGKLHAEGLIRFAGFSEVTGAELRRAHAVFPVSAVQLEWSLMTRDVETDVIPAARALGVGIVAYSPLGRGLLSATVAKRDDLASTDWRLSAPRFSEGNLPANAAAAARIAAVAARKGVTPAQVALAWVHARGDDVVPIPGTKTVARLRENVAAVGVHLTPEESAEVEAAGAAVQGARYASAGMAATFNARADL